MRASEWIDRAIKANHWPSDYRAAKELQLSRATVSIYRSKETATLDDAVALRVASAIGVRPAVVLLDQLAERTKSDEARDALRAVLRQVQRCHRSSRT
jgi:hypothetical protein